MAHSFIITLLLLAIPFFAIDAQTRKIQIKIEALDGSNNVVVSDNGMVISLSANGTHGWDIYDASKLLPLSSTYINGALLGVRNGNTAAKTIDSRPLFIADTMNIDLRYYTQNVNVTGRWSIHELNNIPDSWQILLIDNDTETTTNLRNDTYSFSLPASNGTYDGRFTLSVNPMSSNQFTIDSEGWSLVGFPYDNDFTGVKNGLWTQGFTGADTENGTSNIYTYSEASANFVAINSVSDVLDWTKGFAIFTFADDDPTTAGIQGDAQKTVSVTLPYYKENITKSLTHSGTSESGWQLLSNPFWENMQVNQLNIDGNSVFTQFVYLWNMQSEVYNLVAANATTNIAPHRGFWVLISESTSLTFSANPPASKTQTYRQELSLDVTEIASGRNSTFSAHFSPDFSLEYDNFDAPILQGLSAKKDLGYFPLSTGAQLKAISLPENSREDSSYEIPFAFTAAGEHRVQISSTFKDMEFFLLSDSRNISLEGGATLVTEEGELWTLVIAPKTQTHNEENPTLAESMRISAYPNPFNPSTTISLDVVEQGNYRLEVRDIVGRVVLSAPEKYYAAGNHIQTLDASSWASGIYIVNFSGNTFSKSIKINLIR